MTLHPALFAISLVLYAAAGDRELILSWPDGSEVRVCAKATARGLPDPCDPVVAGRWQPLGYPSTSTATTRCVPRPSCFTDRSNCIAGFNCGE